jgi:DsbC/DsbD-like thiol-disulfide interchange protein
MVDMLKLVLSYVIALFAAAAPLTAQDRLQPVEARILPGWVMADGARMIGLDIRLAPGWKTYWRAPGDAGIPPTFDWSGSRNLGAAEISWPAPRVFVLNGMRSFGYDTRLVLPVKISPHRPGTPIEVALAVDMGVCSDVCVPYQMSLSATLDDATTRPTPAIASALAQQPYSEQEAGVSGATCRIEPIRDGLRIEARVQMPSAGGPEIMVIEPGLPDIWVSEAETRRHGSEVIAVSDLVHLSGTPFALDRSAVRMTVIGQRHAVDILGCSAG